MTNKKLAETVLRACVREMFKASMLLDPYATEQVSMSVIENALIKSQACTRQEINTWGGDEEHKRYKREKKAEMVVHLTLLAEAAEKRKAKRARRS